MRRFACFLLGHWWTYITSPARSALQCDRCGLVRDIWRTENPR